MASKAVRFTNFSDEDFVGVWDKEEFLIPAGESIMLQEYLALHFAKHLIDRELNKQNKSTNLVQYRNPMIEKCIGKVFIEAESDLKLEQKMYNQPKEEKEEKPATKPEEPENEFEGLQDTDESEKPAEASVEPKKGNVETNKEDETTKTQTSK